MVFFEAINRSAKEQEEDALKDNTLGDEVNCIVLSSKCDRLLFNEVSVNFESPSKIPDPHGIRLSQKKRTIDQDTNSS